MEYLTKNKTKESLLHNNTEDFCCALVLHTNFPLASKSFEKMHRPSFVVQVWQGQLLTCQNQSNAISDFKMVQYTKFWGQFWMAKVSPSEQASFTWKALYLSLLWTKTTSLIIGPRNPISVMQNNPIWVMKIFKIATVSDATQARSVVSGVDPPQNFWPSTQKIAPQWSCCKFLCIKRRLPNFNIQCGGSQIKIRD